MTKILRCGDLISGCDFEARADTEEEILQAASDHALMAHGLELTAELVDRVREAIRPE